MLPNFNSSDSVEHISPDLACNTVDHQPNACTNPDGGPCCLSRTNMDGMLQPCLQYERRIHFAASAWLGPLQSRYGHRVGHIKMGSEPVIGSMLLLFNKTLYSKPCRRYAE